MPIKSKQGTMWDTTEWTAQQTFPESDDIFDEM